MPTVSPNTFSMDTLSCHTHSLTGDREDEGGIAGDSWPSCRRLSATAVPIALTTMPDSPSRSKFWKYLIYIYNFKKTMGADTVYAIKHDKEMKKNTKSSILQQ